MGNGLTLKTFNAPQRRLEPRLDIDAPDGGWTFPPTSVTLIAGEREAILVDTVHTLRDSDALADWIQNSGKSLTTVFVTHGHFDHCFGAASLLKRFPDARLIATEAMVRHIGNEAASGVERAVYSTMFVDELVPEVVVPEVLAADRIDLEGYEVIAVAAGQSDHVDSSYVYLPELGAVVVGDIAYNDVHCALMGTDHVTRTRWIDTLKEVQALNPQIVMTGHRRANAQNDIRALAETITYIENADRLLAETSSAVAFVEHMLELHPTRLNASTLLFSAAALGLD